MTDHSHLSQRCRPWLHETRQRSLWASVTHQQRPSIETSMKELEYVPAQRPSFRVSVSAIGQVCRQIQRWRLMWRQRRSHDWQGPPRSAPVSSRTTCCCLLERLPSRLPLGVPAQGQTIARQRATWLLTSRRLGKQSHCYRHCLMHLPRLLIA